MKAIYFLLVVWLILSSSTCKKEGPDCHYKIIIENRSNAAVILAVKGYMDGSCHLGKREDILAGTKAALRINSCWEQELSSGRTQELFIVDPGHFNPSGLNYHCDSIGHYNTILKSYVLTLEDLKNRNFAVTYP